MATNTANIATNTTDIATNVTGISANATDIATVDAKLNNVSHTEPSRALDTVYQNGSKIRMVTVTLRAIDATSWVEAKVENATPPTVVIVNWLGETRNEVGSLTFIVPPNEYYACYDGAGTPSKQEWHEWDLF